LGVAPTLQHFGWARKTRLEDNYELLDSQLERVIAHADTVEIALRPSSETDAPAQRLIVPWRKPSGVRRHEILEAEACSRKNTAACSGRAQPAPSRHRPRAELARATHSGRRSGSLRHRQSEKKSGRSIRMTLSLAFLDPTLIKVTVETVCREAMESRASLTCRPISVW
jgi:hypothetical protein